MKVWLASVDGRRQVDVAGADDTVGALLSRSGLPATTSAVFAGRVLDPALRLSELSLNPASHIVVLAQRNPEPASSLRRSGGPMFDPAAVSGLLAQLNLQFQPPAAAAAAVAPRFGPREEALILELMEMGFSRNRSKHAVLAAGNNASLERCSEWIVETIEVLSSVFFFFSL